MKVFITREIPASASKLLEDAGYSVIVSQKDDILTHEELLQQVTIIQPDAIISLLTDTIDATVFDAGPSIRVVANYAVGFNNIHLEEAKRRGITITNTPDVLTDSVAEHTIALMLGIAKRLGESERFIRAGKYTGWGPLLLLGTELKGKQLGLVGAGRIGGRVAEIAAKGFGMTVKYSDVKKNESIEQNTGAVFCESLDELLQHSDFVSIHVPLLPSTKHLISADRLGMMKQSAYLINTARGPIVDEQALVTALQQKKIRGAALDVFENEPALTPGLVGLENVLLTPHTASASDTARNAMAEVAANNVIAILSGKPALNQVQ